MEDSLEKIIKEKISADHLLYVSMKYTKTCDVILNLIKRWKIMIDCCFDGILKKMKKEKIIKKIPTAPKLKIDSIRDYFKKNELIQDILKEYEIFQKIEILKKTKEGEFRKGVCLTIFYRGEKISVNLEKLKEYSEILEKFINYTKLFLAGKNN